MGRWPPDGTFLDDLDDHEGYADRRLPNGQLAGGVWTYATREFTAYVAVCECGWQATGEHPPTEDGEEAIDRGGPSTPPRLYQATRRREELGRILGWLGGQANRLEDPATWSASAAPWAGPGHWSMTCSATWSGRRPSGRPAVN